MLKGDDQVIIIIIRKTDLSCRMPKLQGQVTKSQYACSMVPLFLSMQTYKHMSDVCALISATKRMLTSTDRQHWSR